MLLKHSRILVERTADDSDTSRHLVQAALNYFTLAEDADHDFTSLTGLDDDVDVLECWAIVDGNKVRFDGDSPDRGRGTNETQGSWQAHR